MAMKSVEVTVRVATTKAGVIRQNRRIRILMFLISYKRKHDGNTPSIREIMQATAISSSDLVEFYLDQLAQSGFIRRKVRHIEIVGGSWSYSI
jgi:SOS-response transcriptional repressor LexA